MQDLKEVQSNVGKKQKKLKLEYRKIKDRHSKTGEGRQEWKFFEVLNDILGDKPATHHQFLGIRWVKVCVCLMKVTCPL